MDNTVKVTLEVDRVTFWRVTEVARKYGKRVDEYLIELAAAQAKGEINAALDAVVVRWHMGMTDKQIARELRMTNQQVATRRRRAKLPANKEKSPVFTDEQVRIAMAVIRSERQQEARTA